VGVVDNGSALITSFIGRRAAEGGLSRGGRHRWWNFNGVGYKR
jgi:hypothetical protein